MGIRFPNDLFSLKELVRETCIGIDGELILKEYPTKTASPTTLKTHLEKLRKSASVPYPAESASIVVVNSSVAPPITGAV